TIQDQPERGAERDRDEERCPFGCCPRQHLAQWSVAERCSGTEYVPRIGEPDRIVQRAAEKAQQRQQHDRYKDAEQKSGPECGPERAITAVSRDAERHARTSLLPAQRILRHRRALRRRLLHREEERLRVGAAGLAQARGRLTLRRCRERGRIRLEAGELVA